MTTISPIIHDPRDIKFFRDTTFSCFKKNDVKKSLEKAWHERRIDYAQNWIAELNVSLQYSDIWIVIWRYWASYINIANPNLPRYLFTRYNEFTQIMKTYVDRNILIDMRNNLQIRVILAEITAIFSQSQKRQLVVTPKTKPEDFDIRHVIRMARSRERKIDTLWQQDDPRDAYIPLNEFWFSITRATSDITAALRWLQWIYDWEAFNIETTGYYTCARRENVKYADKYAREIVWLIWDILKAEAHNRDSDKMVDAINCIFEIYCIDYNHRARNQRQAMLIMATTYLCEGVDFSRSIFTDEIVIRDVVGRVNNYYADINRRFTEKNTWFNVEQIAKLKKEREEAREARKNPEKHARVTAQLQQQNILLNAFHSGIRK